MEQRSRGEDDLAVSVTTIVQSLLVIVFIVWFLGSDVSCSVQ